MRTLIRRLHLWIGLSLGTLFVLLGVTGSALVFYVEIDRVLHPAIALESRARADWDRALHTVHTAFPDKGGPWRFEITGNGGAIPARYYNPPETAGRDFAPMMVWLSPDGERVLRRDYWGDYTMTFIYDLHFRLLAGETGGVVVGYAGLALLVLLLSGLASWWPRGRWGKALRYKRDSPAVRRLRDQHKLIGLGASVVLMMLVGTGVMLALPDESDAVLAPLLGKPDAVPAPVASAGRPNAVGVARALSLAQRALPTGRVAWIETPGTESNLYRFRMRQPGDPSHRFPHSFVWVDAGTGQVLAIADASRARPLTRLNTWLHPLHDGSAGGLPLRIAALIAGFAPMLLFVTGWRRWRARRKHA